jgi:hypothetical protein
VVLGLAGALVLAGALLAVRHWGRTGSPRAAPRTAATPAASPVPQAATPAAQPPRAPVTIELPPPLHRETLELLALLKAKDYERILDNYCQPDQEDFSRVQRTLEHIVRGPGAAGFRRWSRLVIRLGTLKAIARLQQAGDPHPVYTADLLTHLARDPGASGAHVSAERRARSVLRWHIAGLFEGIDLARAEIAPTARRIGGDVVVTLDCGGAPAAVRPGDDPRRLRWRTLPVGMVLKLALADRLETIRGVLDQPDPAATAPAGSPP